MNIFNRVFKPPFLQSDVDRFQVNLEPTQRELLADLLQQVRELLTTDSPALERLFPPAYGDDVERSAGYAVLAGSELVEKRLDALSAFESEIELDELTTKQLSSWMRCLNDIRLILGTALNLTDDEEVPEFSEDGLHLYAVYEELGYLLEYAVRALSGTIPDS